MLRRLLWLTCALLFLAGPVFATPIPRPPVGGGSPTDATYWVGSSNPDLSAEIVVNDEATLEAAIGVALATEAESANASNLSTGTIPAARVGADHIDAITELDAALRSGSDGTVITGTAGAQDTVAIWNADGDLVDAGELVVTPFDACRLGVRGGGYDATTDTYAWTCGNRNWSAEKGGNDGTYGVYNTAVQAGGVGEYIDCTGQQTGVSQRFPGLGTLDASGVGGDDTVNACQYAGETIKINAMADLMLAADHTRDGGRVYLPNFAGKDHGIYVHRSCGSLSDGTQNACPVLRAPNNDHWQRMVQVTRGLRIIGEGRDPDGVLQSPEARQSKRSGVWWIDDRWDGDLAATTEANGDNLGTEFGRWAFMIGGDGVDGASRQCIDSDTDGDLECEIDTDLTHLRIGANVFPTSVGLLDAANNDKGLYTQAYCISDNTVFVCEDDVSVSCSTGTDCSDRGLSASCLGFPTALDNLLENGKSQELWGVIQHNVCSPYDRDCAPLSGASTAANRMMAPILSIDTVGGCGGGQGHKIVFGSPDPAGAIGINSGGFISEQGSTAFDGTAKLTVVELGTINNAGGGVFDMNFSGADFWGRDTCVTGSEDDCDDGFVLGGMVNIGGGYYGIGVWNAWHSAIDIGAGNMWMEFFDNIVGYTRSTGSKSDTARVSFKNNLWIGNIVSGALISISARSSGWVDGDRFIGNLAASLINFGTAHAGQARNLELRGNNCSGGCIFATSMQGLLVENVESVGNVGLEITLSPDSNGELVNARFKDWTITADQRAVNATTNRARAVVQLHSTAAAKIGGIQGLHFEDFSVQTSASDAIFLAIDNDAAAANATCSAAGDPDPCCTGSGTGNCPRYLQHTDTITIEGVDMWHPSFGSNALCTASLRPWGCCTGSGAGTCDEDGIPTLVASVDLVGTSDVTDDDDAGVYSLPFVPVMLRNSINQVEVPDQPYRTSVAADARICDGTFTAGHVGLGATVKINDDTAEQACTDAGADGILDGGGSSLSICVCEPATGWVAAF